MLIIIDSLSDSLSISVSLRVSLIKPPSSNCANVITSPDYSFKDAAYGVYVTAGRIAIASEDGRDVYDNALEKLSSNTTSYDDIVFDESFSSALSYTSRPYSEAMAMRPAVTYTPYAMSSKEKNGDVITFAHFEEGKY